MKSITYVSNLRLSELVVERALEDIAAFSTIRNARSGVTGALVASQRHFVQTIEGPDAAIDSLVAALQRDNRHSDMRIVIDKRIGRRDFAGWDMKNLGRARYLDRHIDALLEFDSAGVASVFTVQLAQLMVEFGRVAQHRL